MLGFHFHLFSILALLTSLHISLILVLSAFHFFSIFTSSLPFSCDCSTHGLGFFPSVPLSLSLCSLVSISSIVSVSFLLLFSSFPPLRRVVFAPSTSLNLCGFWSYSGLTDVFVSMFCSTLSPGFLYHSYTWHLFVLFLGDCLTVSSVFPLCLCTAVTLLLP